MAMQVADGRCIGIYARGPHKTTRSFWCAKGFLNFVIVKLFGEHIAASAKVMRLALYHGASLSGIFHYLARSGNNFIHSSVMISLRYVYMYALKPRVYSSHSIL